ncbi:AraC family transcriptional regulator [Alteromonas gracilis]|uniref:AraC family transcriptional regulator n=1 Tax=Alteromonas gracilis TaxID=1479524 RepID=A0ABX5CUL6_9ALTE|nr:helix-turn-helix domain-containing protein [Alteromonas gracilis]PRO70341.1 AraC family transcriptional regulator [Alteromonas gracilis]
MQPSFKDIVDIGPSCFERFIDSSNAPEISELEIELAGCSNLSGNYTVGRVSPPNHTLFYCLSGKGVFRTPCENPSLSEGQLIILPANQSFEVSIVSEQWDIIWLNLADVERWKPLRNRGAVVLDNVALEGLHHAMELLYLERDVESRQAAMQIVSKYLYTIIEKQLGECKTGEQKERRQINRLNSLFSAVDKQLQFDWDIKSLSEKAHYSSPHLHRLCLQTYGRSPKQHVIHLRMARAKSLLLSTQWPVSYIASYVGYANVFTFSKRFKKSTGMSPTEFRNVNEQSSVS